MKPKFVLALALLLSSFGIMAMGNARAEPPAKPPQENDKSVRRVDRYGDPLPPGAIARLGTLRFRLDTQRVDQVAFAPDGKTLAAAWYGGMTFFDAANGKPRKTIKPIGTGISRLVYSPDGKRLLAYAHMPKLDSPEDAAVQTWDVATESKIAETELKHVCWLGWSVKGQPRAATLDQGEIVYHELETGRKQRLPAKDLFDPQLVSLCRCVAAENRLVASGGNGAIHVWDVSNGKERFTLQPSFYVISLALSADGRRLASVSRGDANKNPVQLWDTATGKLVRSLGTGYEVLFAPDDQTLVVSTRVEMRFWDAATGRQMSRIRRESGSFGSAFAFSPDSKTLATTDLNGGAIHLWDVAGGKIEPQPQGHTHPANGISFSPDSKRVATCAFQDGSIRIWDTATGEPLFRIRHPGWPRDGIFSTDGRTLYSCWTGNKVYCDDAADGRERFVLTVPDPDRPKLKPDGLGLHLSDDGSRLTVFHTGDDKFLEMLVTGWDTATRKQLYQRRRVHDVFWNALSPDGRMLAAAHAGSPEVPNGRVMGKGPMYLEDLASGEKLLTFPSLAGQTVPLAFSPDGRLLVSYNDAWTAPGHQEETLRLWEELTATELRAFPILFAKKAAFSPNGRLLALTAPEGEILVWDVRRAREHRRFRGLGAQVNALAFSPDNRRLISGLPDSTLLIWDIPTCDNPRGERTVEEVARAWDDLGATDAPRAFRARWLLVSAPEKAMALLSKRLHAVPSHDPQRLHRLLADLDSEQFAVREKAQEELAALGDLAEPAQRQAMDNKPTLEMRRRLQVLLERLRGPVTRPELLQVLRAVAVLEDIGTPEARLLLEQLAKGAPEARLTREAKASLRRLDLRKSFLSRDR